MKSINFSIIIPNLNGAELLPDCLNSLLTAISKKSLSASGRPQSKFEIILVDNASTDNSISLAQKIHPKIKIIKNTKNLGVAPTLSQGILTAKYPWVIPCNNDIKFHPQWFVHIIKAIQKNKNPKIITYFGTILNKTGDHIESTGLNFDYSGKCTHLDHNKTIVNCKLPGESKSRVIEGKTKNSQFRWGTSAALVVYRTSVVKKIGAFDSDFFAYEEDVDLSLRLHNLGYKTLWIPRAISYHLGGATSKKMGNFRNRHDTKNWIYIIIKNYSLTQIWQNLPGIIEQRLRNLSGLLKNTPLLLWLPTLISVYGQVIINLPAMFAKRKQIKRLTKNLKID